MKLFLDDLRDPPDNTWQLFRDPYNFISEAKHATPNDTLSLDHDLGEDTITGYDVMKQLEKAFILGEIWTQGMPEILFHSQNPVGLGNMRQCLAAMQRYIL